MIWLVRLLSAGCFVWLAGLGGVSAAPQGNVEPGASDKPLRVVRINPSGEDVPVGRQIVFQFDRAVVPLGRMDREASEVPIDITPEPGCEWRWLDISSLACQLGESDELLPSTRYRIVVRPEIVGIDGGRLTGPHEHTFITERVRASHTWLQEWTAPGEPNVRLTLNQDVNADSLQRHLFFALPEGRVPVEVLHFEDSPTTWIVSPETPLPLDTDVSLTVEPGIESVKGNEPSVDARPLVVFKTFPRHRFLGVQCYSVTGKRVFHAVEADAPGAAGCDPLSRADLVFSAPVMVDMLRKHLSVTPDLAGGRDDYDPWEGMPSYSRLRGASRVHRYDSGLPEVLRAHQEYRLQAPAEGLTDEFGRPLAEPIDFRFRTDHRRPKLHLGHEASVLEKQVETHLPVTITNLDAVRADFHALTVDGLSNARLERTPAPEARDVAFRFPLKVREWLGGRSGVVAGRISGDPLTREKRTRFFSQVTPYHLHAKIGHYNSLVWLTDLATGEPVAGASVSLVARRYDTLAEATPQLGDGETWPGTVEVSATTDDDGVALLPGTNAIDPQQQFVGRWNPPNKPHLFVRVEKDGELALLPLAGDFSVGTYRFVFEDHRKQFGHLRTWGATAQGIYRAGDTIQYKIYVRNEGNEILEPAPRDGYRLKIVDPMGKTVLEREDLELNDFGAFDGEWKVPESGAVGWYRFELTASFAGKQSWAPLQVLVSDFTPAPFRVTADLSAELYRPGETVEVTTTASLHAGGPYVDAPTRVTASLAPSGLRSEDPLAKGFWFDPGQAPSQKVFQREGAVDGNGEALSSFEVESDAVAHGWLRVETAVRDDRGKYVASSVRARFAGRDRYVGLKIDEWVWQSGQPAEVRAVVADEHGNLVEDTPIAFVVERRETKASRVKSAGNVYRTQYIHTWHEAARCEAVSAAEPVTCTFMPGEPGPYRVTATIQDTEGRTHASHLTRWTIGRGYVLWEQSDSHQLELIPEKDEYRVGETARYLVKNPYPGARALISVERNGVIRSWPTTLSQSSELIEVPIEPDFLPGFYLSVVVMSPRVEPPPGQAGGSADDDDEGDNREDGSKDAASVSGSVDLGKPSFRVGYARTVVRDPYKEIAVTAKPSGEVFKPGETVSVEISARPRQPREGETSVPPMEFAVAVLDESVLDLVGAGESAWDPYAGFYQLGGLDVFNYSLLTRLIGLVRFEKKGANPGGGGGGGLDPAMRSNFRFVSYWNPSIHADDEGRANIEFRVPDNLTAWRVLVMAVTPGDRLGLGQASFRVNRPTELRPALPNQLIEGDRFTARFTVMNRTDTPRTLKIEAEANGDLVEPSRLAKTIVAAPFKRVAFGLPVTTRVPGEVRLEVRAGDDADADGLRVSVPIGPRSALEAAATYGSTTDASVELPIAFPRGMRTDVGRLSVIASPTVIGALEGAFAYMRDYPYICWEQVLSKGVMAAHFIRLEPYLSDELEWDDADDVARQTLDLAANYQAPNGGMTYFTPHDAHASPYLSAYTALAFVWMREEGYEIPRGVEDRLHEYLLRLLRKDAFPGFFSKGMASSVRAVTLAALTAQGKLTLDDVMRYVDHVPEMDLFGKAHYLQALGHLQESEAYRSVIPLSVLRERVTGQILAHANESGGKFVLSEALDHGFRRMLYSEVRSSCAVLSALMRQGESSLERAGAGRVPFKMVRTLTQRREQRDRWENTQENLFCTRALIDYAGVYEQVEPDLRVDARLTGESLGSGRLEGFGAEPLELSREHDDRDPGREATLLVTRQGDGRLYYAARLFYAPSELKTDRINSGMEVRKEYSVEREDAWVRLGEPGASYELRRGELVRVDLYVTLPAARSFVVVDDPVPGGLEPVNRQLATASTVDADKAVMEMPPDAYYFRYEDWHSYAYSRWSFYHQELRHDSARFYSEFLPAGRYHLSYTAQAIAPGEFTVLPAHAEEMYDPDVFGQGLPGALQVEDE